MIYVTTVYLETCITGANFVCGALQLASIAVAGELPDAWQTRSGRTHVLHIDCTFHMQKELHSQSSATLHAPLLFHHSKPPSTLTLS